MNQTFRQRSMLAIDAERRMCDGEADNVGDALVGAVGIVGCIVLLVLAMLGWL